MIIEPSPSQNYPNPPMISVAPSSSTDISMIASPSAMPTTGGADYYM